MGVQFVFVCIFLFLLAAVSVLPAFIYLRQNSRVLSSCYNSEVESIGGEGTIYQAAHWKMLFLVTSLLTNAIVCSIV